MEALCPIAVMVGIVALFASHPYWKGKLRLQNKNGSGTGSAIALQEIVEPNVQHVIQVKEHKRGGAEKGPPPDEDGSARPK